MPKLAWARLGTTRLRHAGVVRAVQYSPDGNLLATAGDDGVVRVWTNATWQLRHALTKHTGPVQALAFSPDGAWLATGGSDGQAIVWQVARGTVVRTVSGHRTPVLAVGFSADGKRLMSASADRVQVVDTASGKLVSGYKPGPARSHSFALSRSGRFVISARDKWTPGGKLDIWRVGSKRAYSAPSIKDWPRAVAVSPSGWKFAQLVRWQDPTYPEIVKGYVLYIRDARSRAIRHVLRRRHRRGDPHLVTFSPDGSRVVVARSGRLDVWNAINGRRLRTIKVPFVSATAMTISPDLKRLVVASARHHTPLHYDLATGKAVAGPVGNPGPIVSLDVTRRGDRVAVAHGDVESASEWLVGSSARRSTFAGLVIGVRRGARSVVYGRGDSTVISAHDNCLMQVWKADTGRLIERVGCRPKGASPSLSRGLARTRIAVHGVAGVFRNGHGITLAAGKRPRPGGGDPRVARITAQVSGHRSVALSADGKLAAVGAANGEVSLWQLVTGKRLATLRGHLGPVLTMRFAAGARLLFTGSADTTVLVWDVISAVKQAR